MLLDADTLIICCTKRTCAQKLRIPSNRKRLVVTCPKCQTSWDWIADDSRTKRLLRFLARSSTSLWILIPLVLLAGVWTQAWLPTGLFLIACLVWIWRNRLSESDSETLWEKGAGVIYETTASACACYFSQRLSGHKPDELSIVVNPI
jgi:hypothetical protein